MKQKDQQWLSQITFYGGAGMCILAVMIRLQNPSAEMVIAGLRPITLFQVGVGLMVFHCAWKLRKL
jgi:hypothetical protein